MEYQKKEFSPVVQKTGIILTLAGLAVIILSYIVNPERSAYNNIIGLTFFGSIVIGSLVLVALEYLSGAVWSVLLRRVSEFLASALPIMIIFAIPVLFNMHGVFHWTHTEHADEILKAKSPYLNIPFFLVRFFAVMVLLYLFYWLFIRNSRKQDVTSDQKLTKSNVILSALFMPVAAVGLTVLSVDWIMSLEPHWFSTIFGIYYISGTLLAGLAATTFAGVSLGEKGYITGINRDHYYSLGALMFGITNFWAYIAFSQFLLIWYANIPEETFWFVQRWQGGWAVISVVLIIIKFAVPYAGLLSQPSKSDPKKLKTMSVIILFAHFFDLYWLVMPTYSKTITLSWYELGFPLFVIGILILVFNINAKKNNLIPVGDPKLKRALDFHL